MNNDPGRLIVFEGIDGSGKTTQAKLLYDALKKRGFSVLLSREPTDGKYGRRIKALAKGKRTDISPLEEYELFINDRMEHVREFIKPSLSQGHIVILDRYYFSTIAYQGVNGIDPEKIKIENESFAPVPDLVFIIRIPVLIGILRIKENRNQSLTIFEREDSLIRVADLYDAMNDEYIIHIDGMRDPEDIHKEVMNRVNEIL